MTNINIQTPLIDWTGHPLVDAGIATVCAMVDKPDPKDLTPADLDQAADEMADYYFSGVMTSYLTCVFMNSAYVQPNMSEEKRKEYENKVLRAHRHSQMVNDGTKCPFSTKLASTSIHRGQMPMLTGENVLNFFPAARGALPIYGPYLTALQALPLGGRRVEGRLLVAHADLPELTLAFARWYLEDNRRLLGLAKAGKLPAKDGPSLELEREHGSWDTQKKRPKYPDAKGLESLLVSDLIEIWQKRQGSGFIEIPVSITAYWLSNSGQGPSLDAFHLPAQVVRFLILANQAPNGNRWRGIVAKGWRNPREKDAQEQGSPEAASTKKTKVKKKEESPVPGGPGRSRNSVLADLFAVYQDGFMNKAAAKSFLRRHLFRDSMLFLKSLSGGSRLEDGTKPEQELIHWPITKLFLKEVMNVDERYIAAITQFADRLAEHINRGNDRGLFRNIVFAAKSWELRNALVKAQRNQAKEKNQLLFGLQEYLSIFESEDAVGRNDWSLIKDLISIRLVEQLYRTGFFEKAENKELLAEPEEKST